MKLMERVMENIEIIGDSDGIALWNMMSESEDDVERAYFARICEAASKYGTAWFTDSVTQRETWRSQTLWQIVWNNKESKWEISHFCTPNGKPKTTKRIDDFKEEQEMIELDIADLILQES